MTFWQSLEGQVQVELTSADLTGALDVITASGISIQDALCTDMLHLRFSVPRRQLPILHRLAKKRGEEVTLLRRQGIFYLLFALLHRPVLVFGLAALLITACWVPTRVLFVQVEGNHTISRQAIIEKAAACGIGFNASRREVRSERVKNALLEAMPELQWAGVNTYGCVAVIAVRERSDVNIAPQEIGVSSIVAARDGIIREMTVLRGNALCKPGQAVRAGQMLVSGYTDCGIVIQATRANAEIFGETQRSLTVLLPKYYDEIDASTASEKKFSIIIGKKRINFFKGSGISGTTCAKIYEEKYLTLPGGFQLPIALCWEQEIACTQQPVQTENAQTLLEDFAHHYLSAQMIAGRIESCAEFFSDLDDVFRLDGVYGCYEMLGISKMEETTIQ